METIKLIDAATLSAPITTTEWRVAKDGMVDLTFAVWIHNGADLAPTSVVAPVGMLVLQLKIEGTTWVDYFDNFGALADVSPTGNVRKSQFVVVRGVPSATYRIVYRGTSGAGSAPTGGGAGTSCSFWVVTV